MSLCVWVDFDLVAFVHIACLALLSVCILLRLLWDDVGGCFGCILLFFPVVVCL